jgi:hypothetical protein
MYLRLKSLHIQVPHLMKSFDSLGKDCIVSVEVCFIIHQIHLHRCLKEYLRMNRTLGGNS